MPYTRPSGSAADFQFTGVAYARADPANAPFSFAPGAKMVSGFRSTGFGTPLVPIGLHTGTLFTQFGLAKVNVRTYATSVSVSTAFGTPTDAHRILGGINSTTFGTPTVPPIGVGWSTTVFGTPNSPYTQARAASGFSDTTFGTARLTSRPRASGFLVTTISRAYYAFNDTAEAEGFSTTQLGAPIATATTPTTPIGRKCTAAGWLVPVFGEPVAVYTQAAVASGAEFFDAGTPSARLGQVPTGWETATFGTPAAVLVARPAGFNGTIFGTATAARVQPASGLYREPRWGLPTVSRPNTYLVYGIDLHGRFGQPTGLRRFNYPATGITPGSFGTPAALDTHRVTHIPPTPSFGTPLLQRPSEC